MQRKTFWIVGVALIILSQVSASLLNAEPIHLQFGDTRFPILIDFPIVPKASSIANPALADSTIYYYTANDESAAIGYTVTIVSIPKNLGKIPRDTAEMMIEQSLQSQIGTVDDAVGVKGKVIRSSSENIKGYPSKHLAIVRKTSPSIYSEYRAVMADRLLVTVWATGLDTTTNRSRGKAFTESLQIK